MAKVSADSGKKRDVIPADGYDAWCYASVELGTQDGEFEGVPNQAKKIRLFFEIPELQITYTDKDGKEVTAPQVINVEYTNSAGKKAKLKPILEAWTGMDVMQIDLVDDLIGRPARISVINKTAKSSGNPYAQISGIGKCKEKDIATLPPMHNSPMGYSVADHGFDTKQFNDLYDWLKEEIKKSHEYKKYLDGPGTTGTQEATEDDMPFK